MKFVWDFFWHNLLAQLLTPRDDMLRIQEVSSYLSCPSIANLLLIWTSPDTIQCTAFSFFLLSQPPFFCVILTFQLNFLLKWCTRQKCTYPWPKMRNLSYSSLLFSIYQEPRCGILMVIVTMISYQHTLLSTRATVTPRSLVLSLTKPKSWL